METQGCSATINRVRVGTIHHVRIAGVIDETFPLTSKIRDLVGFIVLDLGQVERISSFGVSKWIEFTSKLPPGALSLYLVNTPPVMVDQLNMVEGFVGVARVLSVLAPYLCRACGEDRLRLVDLQAEASVIAEGRAPVHTCPVCAGKLEFADLPSEFFDHARRQQFGTVDPLVMRYLRAIMPSAPVPLTTHLKIVQDDITYITLASELTGDLNVRRLATGLEGRVAFDFAHVSRVEPDAIPKLEQVLDTASRGAQVVLCRVTPPALTALTRFSRPLASRINTLWLPSECRHCGNENPQRTLASEYLARLLANASPERECPVCGGTARLPAIPQLVQLLSQSPLVETRLEDIEALEPRALSQYLFSTTEPSEGNEVKESASDLNNDIGATRLRVLRRLGQGGMAEVFLARQVGVKGFEKYVVMKKVLSQYAENTDFVDMLFAEARANARLTHPNVVQTFDMGMSEGVAYILMEYVRGPDLKRLMTEMKRKGVTLPLEHALRIISETAAGLHYAHSYVDPAGNAHPVVHRDVSPHNILISLDGAVKLSDFGIAKVQGEDHTQAGVLKGKISYISPEAAAGRPLDARNDVFALGVVLFELLTGQLPFRRDHDAATLNAIVREPAPVPSQLKPSIPQDVSDLILRALVKDPARRTASAAAMREEIEAVMAHHRLNSSPAAVAQFFKDTLGDRLAEYAPAGANAPGSGSHPRLAAPGELSPSDTRSSARLAGAAGNSGTGSGSRPNLTGSRSGTGSVSGPRPTPNPKSGSGPRPIPAALAPPSGASAEAAGAEAEQAKMRQAAGGQQVRAPSQTGARPIVSVPSQAPGQPPATSSTRSGIRTIPTGTAPAPAVAQSNPPAVAAAQPQPPHRPSMAVPTVAVATASAARNNSQGPSPAPVGRGAVAAPAQAQSRTGLPAISPEPVTVAAPPPQREDTETAPASSRKWVLVAAAVVVLAVAGIIGSRMVGSGSGIEVINLGPGERLYIGGLLVDGKPRIDAPGGLLVSTAVDGRLRRFGRTERRDRIDVRTIPEALPQPGSTGTLSIVGEPAGCSVQVGKQKLEGSTPLKTSIEAGKELDVRLTCPSGKITSVSVMAVPGQEVELKPRQDP